MVEHKGLTAYLSFPINAITKGLLLDEKEVTVYSIRHEGKDHFLNSNFPLSVIKELKKKGAIIKKHQETRLRGRRWLFNVNATSYYDGKDVIRVRIIGRDLTEMTEKLSKVKTAMAKYGFEPKQCVWDRVGRLGL